MSFVGYDEMSKGYRMLNGNGKIVVSREVHFTGRKSEKERTRTVELKETRQERRKSKKKELEYVEFDINPEESEQIVELPVEEEEDDEEFHDAEESGNEGEDSNSEEEDALPRRSERTNQGQRPVRFNDFVMKADGMFETQEPRSYKEALNSGNAAQWRCAMQEELKAIEENGTWEAADLPKGRKAVGSKWVFKEKKDSHGNTIKFKARLVAQGFSQKFGVDYDEVFAPVARQTTFRLLLSVAGTRKYKVKQYDIKSAFLNGKLEEEIYMKQPPGFQDGDKVYRLRKSLYGLKQSARVWNQTLHDALVKQGCRQNEVDNCLYSRKLRGNVIYILIHVDDLLVAGSNEDDMEQLMKEIEKNFEMTNLGGASHYLGIDIEQDSDGRFFISQPAYIDSIVAEAGLENSKISKFPLDTGYAKQLGTPLESNEEYRKLIGMLLYLTTNTRPDIAASVSILSRKVEHPRDNDMNEVKRVIKYLKGTRQLKLMINDVSGNNELTVYSDANWAEDTDDRKSNTGYFVSVNGGTISWSCRKQDLVAMSSAESEYIALAETCKEVLWLREIMKGFDMEEQKTTTILTDSQSCIALLKNQRFSHRTKHFDTRYHFIRDHVTKGSIRLEYVPTHENTADLMTKPLGGIKTEYLRGKAGLVETSIKGATSRRSVDYNECY
jgi:Reverse transcriptase (RNA-dependent DNA polymerase)